MKNLITRSITGAIYVSLIIAGLLTNSLVFGLIFFVICILALWEILNLAKLQKVKPEYFTTFLAASILFISLTAYSTGYINKLYLVLNIPFLGLIPIVELFRNKNKPLLNIAYSFFALVYIVLPLICLIFIYRFDDYNTTNFPFIILGFFILQWLFDTGAYLVGVLVGKTKLYEKISPKKTWEGFIGGAIICIAGAYVYSLNITSLSPFHWIVIAAIIVIFGTLGDLIESMIKRSMNVKDSGKILPGHGGILDRIDSILFSAPLVFVYLTIIFICCNNILL